MDFDSQSSKTNAWQRVEGLSGHPILLSAVVSLMHCQCIRADSKGILSLYGEVHSLNAYCEFFACSPQASVDLAQMRIVHSCFIEGRGHAGKSLVILRWVSRLVSVILQFALNVMQTREVTIPLSGNEFFTGSKTFVVKEIETFEIKSQAIFPSFGSHQPKNEKNLISAQGEH
jgi:hypothetical protein